MGAAELPAGLSSIAAAPRLPGWETRFSKVLEAARHRPYVLGENDCFRLACDVVAALTGLERWAAFAGRYGSRREALALLATWGSSFTEAGTAFFGAPPVARELARRGDILEYRAHGDAHLVACMGTRAAGLADLGLYFVPLAACEHAWRVG